MSPEAQLEDKSSRRLSAFAKVSGASEVARAGDAGDVFASELHEMVSRFWRLRQMQKGRMEGGDEYGKLVFPTTFDPDLK